MNFTKPLKDLLGSPLLDETGKEILMNIVLANQLVQSNVGDAVKFYGWALKLAEGKELDLDKSDKSTLKSFIDLSDKLTILAKAQLLEVFE